MKILITGNKGFVGSHLSKRLEKKHKIIGLDKEMDIRKPIDVRVRPNFIFHLAAVSTIGDAEGSPKDALETNIMGTINILELARKKKIKTVIVSTDKVYGYQPSNLPYSEQTPLKPIGIYDVSKASADLIAQSYIRVFKAPIIIVRPCNIYGYDRNFSRLIPEAITKCLKDETVTLRSDGTPEREYIFIEDVVDAYVKLIEYFDKCVGKCFNIGSGEVLSVMDVVEKIIALTSSNSGITILNTSKNEILSQYLNSTLFRFFTGWKPEHTFDEGIKKTIKKYSQN